MYLSKWALESNRKLKITCVTSDWFFLKSHYNNWLLIKLTWSKDNIYFIEHMVSEVIDASCTLLVGCYIGWCFYSSSWWQTQGYLRTLKKIENKKSWYRNCRKIILSKGFNNWQHMPQLLRLIWLWLHTVVKYQTSIYISFMCFFKSSQYWCWMLN